MKLLILDWYTWKYLIVCNLLVLKIVLEATIIHWGLSLLDTWDHIIACKLSVLDKNTWNNKTVYKQMIIIK